MTDEAKRLADALREDAEWACANEWETPITLGDNLNEAANLIESLSTELEQVKTVKRACGRADNYGGVTMTELNLIEYNGERKLLHVREDIRVLVQSYNAAVRKINQLEDRVKKLEQEAAVEELKGDLFCWTCAHYGDGDYISNDCLDCTNRCNWQWRGVKGEEANDQD